MRFSATAVASTESNSVGSVEIECDSAGLRLALTGLGRFQEDYAPLPLATDREVVVPWPDVQTVRVQGPNVFLTFDDRLLPHNRLTLSRFALVMPEALRELTRQRWMLTAGLITTGLLLVGAAIATGSSSGNVVPAIVLSLCIAVAFALLAMGLYTRRRITFALGDPEAVQLLFIAEVGRFFPHVVQATELPKRPKPSFTLPTSQHILPRSTLAIVITITSAILALALTARWVLLGPSAELRVARLPSNTAPPFTSEHESAEALSIAPPRIDADQRKSESSRAPPTSTAVVPGGSECMCRRATSALWSEPIDRLSILALSESTAAKKNKSELVVDIGIVNNGSASLKEITLNIRFFASSDKGRRFTEERVLYFEGPLEPGRAIKWRTEGEGNEFEVQNPVSGDIGPTGGDAAPANAFYGLLGANHRPVRMHGAMMLAYLGDPRARDAIMTLYDALRENEASYLGRLLWTQNAIKVCDLSVSGSGSARKVKACVFNTQANSEPQVAVRFRALETPVTYRRPTLDPPMILGETTVRLSEPLEGRSGRLVETPLLVEAEKEPAQYEAYADKADVLQ